MNTLKLSSLLVGLILSSSVAYATDANMQKALARAQFMLNKMNAENQQLLQQKTVLESEKKALEEEVDTLNTSLAESQGATSSAEKKIESLRSTLAEWKESHGELTEKLADTREQLGQAKQEITRLNGSLNDQSGNFELCYKNNQKLFDINKELLSLYENKTPMDAIKQREPALGYSRVEVENLVQDYQYKIEDLNVQLMKHQLTPVEDVN